MQEKIRLFILKVTALLGVLTFIYPAVMVGRAVLFRASGGTSGFLGAFLLLFSGFFAALLAVRGDIGKLREIHVYPTLREILSYASVILPMTASALIYAGEGIFRALFEMMVAFLFYFIGVRARYRDYDVVLSTSMIYKGIILIAGSMFITYRFSNYAYLNSVVFFFAYASLILAMLVKNQSNLDRVLKAQGVGTDPLNIPKNIRSYNTLIVLVMFLITLILFNLKTLVLIGLNAAGLLLKGILWVIFTLMSLFPAQSDRPEEEGPASDSMLPLDGTGNETVNTILNIILLIAVIYGIYKLAPAMWKALSNMLKRILRILTGLLKRLFAFSPDEDEAENQQYQDEIEMEVPMWFQRRKKSEKGVRRAKRSLRALNRISDPVQRVRYMYGLILQMLAGKNIPIHPSDTTGEIYQKTLHIEKISGPLREITYTYEQVRYGEQEPAEKEVETAKENFEGIVSVLKELP